MSARAWLGSMVVGTLAVIALGSRPDEPAPAAPPVLPPETPWLSQAAAVQVVQPSGALGPLFDGVVFGVPLAPEARARLEAFEREHHVDIDVELAGDDVRAIRFAATYAGCCGYEGVDVFARRIGRGSTGTCCTCGPDMYIDDWALVSEDGVHMRARTRVNRVELRWERALTPADALARAEELIGADREAVARAAGDRWHEIDPGRRYYLEVPFAGFPSVDMLAFGPRPSIAIRDDLGMHVTTYAGRIVHVRFRLWNASYEDSDEGDARLIKSNAALFRARWGRPDRVEDEFWTWHTKAGAVVTIAKSASRPDVYVESAADAERLALREPR